VIRLWEKDRNNGQPESDRSLSIPWADVAKVAGPMDDSRSTALVPADRITICSDLIAGSNFIEVSMRREMCRSFVQRAIAARRTEIGSQVAIGGWRWWQGQQVMILDDYDLAIAKLYTSGAMCALCFGSLFYTDTFCPGDEKGGEEYGK